jgi:charged multivesicular body protein 3
MLAKSLVGSKRAKVRIHTAKAQMNSVSMQIQQQASKPSWGAGRGGERAAERAVWLWAGMARVAGAIGKSTEVMKIMASLVRMPEIQATMQQLSAEMTKVSLSLVQPLRRWQGRQGGGKGCIQHVRRCCRLG